MYRNIYSHANSMRVMMMLQIELQSKLNVSLVLVLFGVPARRFNVRVQSITVGFPPVLYC